MKRIVLRRPSILTCLGDEHATWNALVAGETGIRELSGDMRDDLPITRAAVIEHIPELACLDFSERRRSSRAALLALSVAADTVGTYSRDQQWGDSCGIFLGTGIGAMGVLCNAFHGYRTRGLRGIPPLGVPTGMPSAPAALISQKLGLRGASQTISTACASSLDALGMAAMCVRAEAIERAIVVGVEAFQPEMLAGFIRTGALDSLGQACPFDVNRNGFALGEGAAAVLVEADSTEACNATDEFELLSYCATSDAHHLTAPDPEGVGARRMITDLLRIARIEASDVGFVKAHGTGTRLNDATEALAIRSVLGSDVPVVSFKGAIGHTIGASGLIEVILALRALSECLIPGTVGCQDPDPDLCIAVGPHSVRPRSNTVIANALGFGGQNSSVLLRSPGVA